MKENGRSIVNLICVNYLKVWIYLSGFIVAFTCKVEANLVHEVSSNIKVGKNACRLHERTPLFSQRSAMSEAETGSSLEIYKIIKSEYPKCQNECCIIKLLLYTAYFRTIYGSICFLKFFCFLLGFLDSWRWHWLDKGAPLQHAVRMKYFFSMFFNLPLSWNIWMDQREDALSKNISLDNHLNHSKASSRMKYWRSSYMLNLSAFFFGCKGEEGGGRVCLLRVENTSSRHS